MTDIIELISEKYGISMEVSALVAYLVFAVAALLVAFAVEMIAKRFILKAIKKVTDLTPTAKDGMFYDRKVFHMMIHYLPLIVLYVASNFYGDYKALVQRLLMLGIMIVTILVIYRSLDAFNDIYMMRDFAKGMPIKGLLQIVKIVVFVFALMIVLVSYNNTGSAMALLGSLGGMSAVILLIFKDSILGFVAGIQLSMNNLLSIGDWIEMPKYQADGEVVDVSLTKISVRNWDKTISHIPAYKFIEESFVNWDGMSKSGGRRIKRNLYIDVNSIGFLSDEQLEDLKEIEVLSGYLHTKEKEIAEHNSSKNDHLANVRKLTNVGTFRAYIREYLMNHPNIKTDDTLLVRQLEAEGNGLPMQVYCFTNDTRWAYYEDIQSDIFDHLYAIMDVFGLEAYQQPTGRDFKSLI